MSTERTASCHFANETQDFFNELEIPFIHRGSNPPNSPQLNPTKRFWGILKAKVYDGGWETKTFRMLSQRIRENSHGNRYKPLLEPIRHLEDKDLDCS